MKKFVFLFAAAAILAVSCTNNAEMHALKERIGATILPGVTVGEHAVVAAGAVVTKDVEPGE